MGERHPDDPWVDFDSLELPTYVGRRLDAGGFILGDPFDTMLRHLSLDYLRAAWTRLHSILHRYGDEPDDLSWGWLHDGETYVSSREQPAPSDFTGWTTLHLDRFPFDDDLHVAQMDHGLNVGMPALRCARTWRSSKWRIAPDNVPVALRLFEALWTEEPSDWSPLAILWDQDRIMNVWRQASAALGERDTAERNRYVAHAQAAYTSPEYRLQDETLLSEPWRKVAAAIEAGSQLHLERSLAEAQAAYSPLGHSILIQGFKKYLVHAADDVSIHLP